MNWKRAVHAGAAWTSWPSLSCCGALRHVRPRSAWRRAGCRLAAEAALEAWADSGPKLQQAKAAATAAAAAAKATGGEE